MRAEEIANKEFPVVMRGYVREEVQAFLASVAAQIAERDARLTQLEADLAEVRSQKAPAAAAGAVDRTTLLRALGEEAASILACADASAERMQAQARIDRARVNHDLRGIGSSLVDVHQLLGELVSLVQSLTDGVEVAAEVQIPDHGDSAGTPEFRTVLGEVLGLDGSEPNEIRLPKESEAGTNP